MVSEPITGECGALVRVGLDPLHSKHVLETLRGSPEVKAQKGQYLLAVGLGRYKWYQS